MKLTLESVSDSSFSKHHEWSFVCTTAETSPDEDAIPDEGNVLFLTYHLPSSRSTKVRIENVGGAGFQHPISYALLKSPCSRLKKSCF